MSKASQEQLLKDITMMMTDNEAAIDDSKIEDLMVKIRKLQPKKTLDQLRLAACHFMTMYHTRKAMTMGMSDQQQMDPYLAGLQGEQQMQEQNLNLEKVEEFKEAQRKDMEMGWDFLDFDSTNESEHPQIAKTARVLKIEIAQRLEDTHRLKSAFDDLMKNHLSEEETLVAFTAAPFLANWKEMRKLGGKIEKYPGGLEQLHMMSLQLPIPDFTLVYDLVKEHNLNNKTPSIDSLVWDLYSVDKIRVKFKEVDCGEFEEKRKELLEEIHKQGDVQWEDVPTTNNVHIKRMGGLCQAVSFGEMPMMLNGPWFDDILHVRGRAEMPLMPENQQNLNPYTQSPDSLTILVQEEEWYLKKNDKNSNLFEGTYTLKQKPILPNNQKPEPEHAPVNMTFDCQIFIGKSKSKKKNNDNNNNNNNNDDDNKESKHAHEDDDDVMENEDNENEQVTGVVTEFDGLTLD